MATLRIDEPRMPVNPKGFALFALGFRPFFLAAGLAAVTLQLIWGGILMGWWRPETYYGLTGWHSHEMLFGYTVAVIAGFLLTAVRNWTNINTPAGPTLALISLLWLLGRVAPFLDQYLPATLIAIIDLSFLPVLGLVLAFPLIRAKQKDNLVFLGILALLTLANALIHSELLGLGDATARMGTYLGTLLIIVLITVMGGRVIPFFTERAVPGFKSRTWPLLEWAGHLSVIAFALSVTMNNAEFIRYSGITAALLQGARLSGWLTLRAWNIPILWVLHIGYAWLVLGFLLYALQGQFGVTSWVALHAFTTGGIGVITMGMMARVALGHTGRMMQAPAVVVWGFVILNLAAALRVFGPWLFPVLNRQWLIGSAVLWIAAFTLFVFVYAPILGRPRVDGRPG